MSTQADTKSNIQLMVMQTMMCYLTVSAEFADLRLVSGR